MAAGRGLRNDGGQLICAGAPPRPQRLSRPPAVCERFVGDFEVLDDVDLGTLAGRERCSGAAGGAGAALAAGGAGAGGEREGSLKGGGGRTERRRSAATIDATKDSSRATDEHSDSQNGRTGADESPMTSSAAGGE